MGTIEKLPLDGWKVSGIGGRLYGTEEGAFYGALSLSIPKS